MTHEHDDDCPTQCGFHGENSDVTTHPCTCKKMEERLKELELRLHILNKMAKEQDDEFMKYYEFYTAEFMLSQAMKIRKRISEVLNQIQTLTP